MQLAIILSLKIIIFAEHIISLNFTLTVKTHVKSFKLNDLINKSSAAWFYEVLTELNISISFKNNNRMNDESDNYHFNLIKYKVILFIIKKETLITLKTLIKQTSLFTKIQFKFIS